MQSREDFDALLDEAAALLDGDHADGSPHARRLSDVMGLIETYQSLLESGEAGDPAAEERAVLLARADELERRFNRTNGLHYFPDLHGPGAAV